MLTKREWRQVSAAVDAMNHPVDDDDVVYSADVLGVLFTFADLDEEEDEEKLDDEEALKEALGEVEDELEIRELDELDDYDPFDHSRSGRVG